MVAPPAPADFVPLDGNVYHEWPGDIADRDAINNYVIDRGPSPWEIPEGADPDEFVDELVAACRSEAKTGQQRGNERSVETHRNATSVLAAHMGLDAAATDDRDSSAWAKLAAMARAGDKLPKAVQTACNIVEGRAKHSNATSVLAEHMDLDAAAAADLDADGWATLAERARAGDELPKAVQTACTIVEGRAQSAETKHGTRTKHDSSESASAAQRDQMRKYHQQARDAPRHCQFGTCGCRFPEVNFSTDARRKLKECKDCRDAVIEILHDPVNRLQRAESRPGPWYPKASALARAANASGSFPQEYDLENDSRFIPPTRAQNNRARAQAAKRKRSAAIVDDDEVSSSDEIH